MYLRDMLLAGSVLAVVACGSTNMTKTGPSYRSRGEKCSFQVLTATPAEGYAEIGTVDVNPGMYGHNWYKDLADFKQEIEPHVCQAGGDAAIAYANGYGYYIKATILKRTGASHRAPAPVAESPGCKFDAQCKGDRICVKGECVAP